MTASPNAARQDFLARRRSGLGGSDMGAILCVSPWRTPLDVWLDKTGRATSDADSLPLRFGTYAEEFVAQEYVRATGNRVERFNTLLQHPTAPIIGNVDRLVVPTGAKRASHMGRVRADRILECKTAGIHAAGRDSAWGEPGTDEVPESYLIQGAVYLLLTGCTHLDLAVLIGGNADFRIYTIGRDPELENLLVETARRWWTDHVLADTPPDPQSETEARQRWPVHAPGVCVEIDDQAAADLRALASIKGGILHLEKQEKALRDRLLPAFGDAEHIIFQGQQLATFKANKTGQRVDWQAVASELNPPDELIATHTRTQPGARVLRLSKEIAA